MVQAHYNQNSKTWDTTFKKPETARQKRFDAPPNHKEWWSPEADRICKLIDSYATLPDDWDSYGASAPEARVIKLAKLAVGAFDAIRVTVLDAVPDAAGRITLSFDFRGATFEVAINEEEWDVMIQRPGQPAQFVLLPGSDPRHVHRVVALA